MKLSQLGIEGTDRPELESDPDIGDIAYDSRQVKPGSLFVAVRGNRYDGHNYIDQAVEKGAVAALVQARTVNTAVPQIEVENTRAALAKAADYFFGHPSRKLKLIGVTGTNGKTTTAYLIESIFRQAGIKTGLIGTIEYRIDGVRSEAARTTPESSDLQRLLARMVASGVEAAVMEVSSHALKMSRVEGCRFAARIFTNLSQDHLDFHPDIEDYFQTKARFFQDQEFGDGLRLVNADDMYGRRIIAAQERGGIMAYGTENGDYRASNIEYTVDQTSFDLTGPNSSFAVKSRLIGKFNVINLLVSAATACELGVPDNCIISGIWDLASVPGRFEKVLCGQDFQVLVDYAHTPDGLEKVLSAAKDLAGGKRLITVFGCGGDRDRGKRPKMGKVAAGLSDLAIVTSDNPRSEAPEAIIEDILKGMPVRPTVMVDRLQAIRSALHEAKTGDVVVIAGKGHEDYQIIKDKVVDFDDRAAAKQVLSEIMSDTN